MDMRFRIDPRDADRAPPPVAPAPPAPKPSAWSTAPPSPPSPPPAPATPTSPAGAHAAAAAWVRDRRALLVALAVLALVGGTVTVTAMYVTDTGPFAYPEQYLLRGDEMPSGMQMAPLEPELQGGLGIHENPGEADASSLHDEMGGPRPSAVWAQGLSARNQPDARVAIVAIKYASEDAAQEASGRIQAVCFMGGGTVLRDGNVFVAVLADGQGESWRARVVAALVDQNDDLMQICGAR